MIQDKPTVYRINPIHLYAIIHKMNDAECARWVRGFVGDLLAMQSEDPYTSGLINAAVAEAARAKAQAKPCISGEIYAEIVQDLNSKSGQRYKPVGATNRLIHARLMEGFKKEDFFTVHDIKVQEWKGTDMAKYIRPETLYGTKFQSYLNQRTVKTRRIQNMDGVFVDVVE